MNCDSHSTSVAVLVFASSRSSSRRSSSVSVFDCYAKEDHTRFFFSHFSAQTRRKNRLWISKFSLTLFFYVKEKTKRKKIRFYFYLISHQNDARERLQHELCAFVCARIKWKMKKIKENRSRSDTTTENVLDDVDSDDDDDVDESTLKIAKRSWHGTLKLRLVKGRHCC